MNAVSIEKLVAVELVRLDPDHGRSLTQQKNSCWLCNSGVPFICEDVFSYPQAAADAAGTRLAQDGADIDNEWQIGFEAGLVQELVLRGTVDWLLGIAVFEVIFHGKPGVLKPQRPSRFLVIQRGVSNAICICETAAAAFEVAKKLAFSGSAQIDQSLARTISLLTGPGAKFGSK